MNHCRVYWGSHGCSLERGHAGLCICSCAFGEDGPQDPRADFIEEGVLNVGAPPYYGPDTFFYGEDAIRTGRVSVPGIIAERTWTRIVVTTPGEPEEWSQMQNEAGEWEPWDVYAQTLEAPPGHWLDVVEEDTSDYPGHLKVLVR